MGIGFFFKKSVFWHRNFMLNQKQQKVNFSCKIDKKRNFEIERKHKTNNSSFKAKANIPNRLSGTGSKEVEKMQQK